MIQHGEDGFVSSSVEGIRKAIELEDDVAVPIPVYSDATPTINCLNGLKLFDKQNVSYH